MVRHDISCESLAERATGLEWSSEIAKWKTDSPEFRAMFEQWATEGNKFAMELLFMADAYTKTRELVFHGPGDIMATATDNATDAPSAADSRVAADEQNSNGGLSQDYASNRLAEMIHELFLLSSMRPGSTELRQVIDFLASWGAILIDHRNAEIDGWIDEWWDAAPALRHFPMGPTPESRGATRLLAPLPNGYPAEWPNPCLLGSACELDVPLTASGAQRLVLAEKQGLMVFSNQHGAYCREYFLRVREDEQIGALAALSATKAAAVLGVPFEVDEIRIFDISTYEQRTLTYAAPGHRFESLHPIRGTLLALLVLSSKEHGPPPHVNLRVYAMDGKSLAEADLEMAGSRDKMIEVVPFAPAIWALVSGGSEPSRQVLFQRRCRYHPLSTVARPF